MTMTLKCGDVVDGCPAEVQGASEDDVLRQAAQHAADAHGLTEIDEPTLAAIKSAIRRS